MEEENKSEKSVSVGEDELKYMKKQWIYKTIAIVVIIAVIVGVMASSVTYYVTLGKKYSDLYKSTSQVKTDDPAAQSVNASETISEISGVLSTFSEIVDQAYIGDIDKNTLIDATVKGFIEGLDDEYSEYLTAEEWKEYQADALGNYVGVGIYISQDENKNAIVVSAIRDTPAERAGLQPKDLILAVDGESTSGMTTTEISNKVKGDDGTDVTLNISRNGEIMDVTMKRESIKVYHAESEMLDTNSGLGYISLITFDSGCSAEFETEMDKLVSEGANKVIIDLRYNTGGLVDEALKILDLFLDKDQVTLITKSADGTETISKSATDKKYSMDVVLLVNEYSASASEIVTAALKDNGRAKVVGTLTYGKGVIQNVYQLLDGSVLKLTTQEYYTSNNEKINKVGIKPDYEVELTDENIKNGVDTQLDKAKEVILSK